jgi:ribonuclease D
MMMMLLQEDDTELSMTNRISKEYINTLPIIRFEGDVIMVTSEQQAEDILKHLMEETWLGFDTESKPSFTKGTSYPVSLVQFSTQDTAYLFQLIKTGFPDRLVELLENKQIKKIGVGIKTDIVKLQEQRFFIPGGFVDLSELAAAKGIIQVGVRGLTARYLHHRLPKTAQKTNWARSKLTMKQQIYAASDAWICLKVYPFILEDTTDYHQLNQDENADYREEVKTEKKKYREIKPPN